MWLHWFLAFVPVFPAMYGPLPDASMWPSTTKSTLHCSFWTRDSRCRWPFSIALSQTIQLMEHSGCASSRLTALLAVVRDDPHQAPLTSRPPDLGPLPDPVPGQPASSSGPTSSGLGSAALSMQLSQLLLYPQVPEESSPTLSPLTDAVPSDVLPPPSPTVLTSSEVAALRAIVSQVHLRLQSRRGVVAGDPNLWLLAWQTTLRHITSTLAVLQPPHGYAPLGSLQPGELPGPDGIPQSPASTLPSPSLANSADLQQAEDLLQIWSVMSGRSRTFSLLLRVVSLAKIIDMGLFLSPW